ncbi:ABC transporter substrate-binding protein [Jiella sp. M17.18]|uniref:ABC transporter substrate-binding protein n=1 Tax=Jiella sp. M17.18 TaxID=3234247 RepID=UPI0034DE644A
MLKLKTARRALGAVLSISLCSVAIAAHADGVFSQKLHDMLPKRIQDAGVVKVGVEPLTPPYEMYGDDKTTIVGMEPDLANEMGKILGVKFVQVPSQFAAIIPGIKAGRFDIGMSSMGDFTAREKIVDVVDYTLEGTSIIVPKGNPHDIHKISDLCGLRAGAVQGSIPLELLNKQAGLCPKDKPLTILQFPAGDQVKAALKSDRVDASMDTTGVTAYALQHQPAAGTQLELVPGAKYAAGYQGIMVGKDDTGLRDAIVGALEEMIANGSYKALFDRYGLSENMIDKITVNDGARFADYMKLD